MSPLEVDWGAVGTIGAAVVGFIGTVALILATRADKKSDRGLLNYDQLQEDLDGLRDELINARERISSLERIDRLKDNYISNLRDHIYAGNPPPPPPWPAELTERP